MHRGGAVQARREATAAAQVRADSPAVAGVEECVNLRGTKEEHWGDWRNVGSEEDSQLTSWPTRQASLIPLTPTSKPPGNPTFKIWPQSDNICPLSPVQPPRSLAWMTTASSLVSLPPPKPPTAAYYSRNQIMFLFCSKPSCSSLSHIYTSLPAGDLPTTSLTSFLHAPLVPLASAILAS